MKIPIYFFIILILLSCRKDPEQIVVEPEPICYLDTLIGNYSGQRIVLSDVDDCSTNGMDCWDCNYIYEYDTLDVNVTITKINDSTIYVTENITPSFAKQFFIDQNYQYHESFDQGEFLFMYDFEFKVSDQTAKITRKEGWISCAPEIYTYSYHLTKD